MKPRTNIDPEVSLTLLGYMPCCKKMYKLLESLTSKTPNPQELSLRLWLITFKTYHSSHTRRYRTLCGPSSRSCGGLRSKPLFALQTYIYFFKFSYKKIQRNLKKKYTKKLWDIKYFKNILGSVRVCQGQSGSVGSIGSIGSNLFVRAYYGPLDTSGSVRVCQGPSGPSGCVGSIRVCYSFIFAILRTICMGPKCPAHTVSEPRGGPLSVTQEEEETRMIFLVVWLNTKAMGSCFENKLSFYVSCPKIVLLL